MGAPNVNNVMRVTGRMYHGVDPTDLEDADTNYGGTPLGLINRIAIKPNVDAARIFGAEYGRTVEALHLEGDFEVGFSFRDWDPETINKIGLNRQQVTVGQESGEVLTWPSLSVAQGQSLAASHGATYLFAADRPSFPSMLLFNAIALQEPEEVINFTFQQEAQLRMYFLCLPNTTLSPVRSVAIGKLSLLRALVVAP